MHHELALDRVGYFDCLDRAENFLENLEGFRNLRVTRCAGNRLLADATWRNFDERLIHWVDREVFMSRSRNETPGETVQAVNRALALLEILSTEGDSIALSKLAKEANLKLTTAHRLINTLMYKGFVQQDPVTLKYRLGLKAFEIGIAAMSAMDLTAVARPFLKELAAQTTETTNLAILDGHEVVYVDQIESTNMVIVKMFARIGNRGPAYCTGTGKVLLADLSEEELRRRFAAVDFIRFTPQTIISIDELSATLKKIRRDGYALDFSERDEGVTCVAAPIKNYENRVLAAISVSGPLHRMGDERIRSEILPCVLDAARNISERLGYHYPVSGSPAAHG